jgi:hypothetical protein
LVISWSFGVGWKLRSIGLVVEIVALLAEIVC